MVIGQMHCRVNKFGGLQGNPSAYPPPPLLSPLHLLGQRDTESVHLPFLPTSSPSPFYAHLSQPLQPLIPPTFSIPSSVQVQNSLSYQFFFTSWAAKRGSKMCDRSCTTTAYKYSRSPISARNSRTYKLLDLFSQVNETGYHYKHATLEPATTKCYCFCITCSVIHFSYAIIHFLSIVSPFS